jgi:hypothetical protein
MGWVSDEIAVGDDDDEGESVVQWDEEELEGGAR